MGIIGSALGVAGSIWGGIAASKAMKNVKNNIKDQQSKNQDWYDRKYNEDATQRGDAQRLLTQTEESIKRRNKASAGASAVMGGTDESVAATKEINNKALADATSQIAANADARKDNIEATYKQNDSAYQAQLDDMEAKKGTAIASAVQGVLGAAGGIDDSAFGIGKNESQETKQTKIDVPAPSPIVAPEDRMTSIPWYNK